MNKDTLFSIINTLSSTANFADWGAAPLRRLNEQEAYYMQAAERGDFATLDYLHNNLEKRLNPALLLEEIGVELIQDSSCGIYTNCSILVFLAPFKQKDKIEEEPESNTCNTIKISKYAWGIDYHYVIKNKLNHIVEQLQELDPMIKARVFTDSAPILERAWAVEAKLGFVGKNNFLISRNCGIANFIGLILVNLPIERVLNSSKDAHYLANKDYCGKCQRCLDSCPSGALYSAHKLNADKCISYQTIENKELISTSHLEPKLNNWLFGCDECMDVCPWNSKNLIAWKEFSNKSKGVQLLEDSNFSIQTIKELSNLDFKKLFKSSPILRSGKNKIIDTLAYLKKNETSNTSKPNKGRTENKL